MYMIRWYGAYIHVYDQMIWGIINYSCIHEHSSVSEHTRKVWSYLCSSDMILHIDLHIDMIVHIDLHIDTTFFIYKILNDQIERKYIEINEGDVVESSTNQQ